MVSRILDCSFDPSSPQYIGAVVQELADASGSSGESVSLKFEHADRIIVAKCAALGTQREQVLWLYSAYERGDELMKKDKMPDEMKKKIPELIQMLVGYVYIGLTLPQVFGGPDDAVMSEMPGHMLLRELISPGDPHQGGSSSSTASPDGKRFTWIFANHLINHMVKENGADDEAQEMIEDLFKSTLERLIFKLNGRTLMNLKFGEYNYIANLVKQRGPIAKAIVKRAEFHPAPPKDVFTGKDMASGFILQTQSLLGLLLRPTSLDTAVFQAESTRKTSFGNMMKLTPSTINGVQGQIRTSISQMLEQVVEFVNPLLRSGDDAKERLLKWFSLVLQGAEGRTKGANQIHEGGMEHHFVQTMLNPENPMSDLDRRLNTKYQAAFMQGFCTNGFSMNLLLLLLELVKPIKLEACGKLLDVTAVAHKEEGPRLLGSLITEKGNSMGDSAAVEQALTTITPQAAYKFPTQIFFMLMKGVNVLLVPCLKDCMCLVAGAQALRYANPPKHDMANACYGEFMCFQSYLDWDKFLVDLAHYCNCLTLFLLYTAYPETKALPVDANRPANSFKGIKIPASSVTPEWTILPNVALQDYIEILEHFDKMQNPSAKGISPFFLKTDMDLLLLMCTFILGSGDHVTNPSMRGQTASLVKHLVQEPRYLQRLQEFPPLVDNFIPACIRCFSAVEKAKQSYYDIRFQFKYKLRIPIMELFSLLIPQAEHRKSLQTFAKAETDDFLKFLNNMMNDATSQLDEGLDTLVAIRQRAKIEKGEIAPSEDDPMIGGTAGLGRNAEMAEDERNEQGEDIYARGRQDPVKHCKEYMDLGHRTIKTLYSLAKEAPDVILGSDVVLPQLIQSALNPCLWRLVGPKCMQLKGDSKDFDKYGFKPKELLSWIVEMYVIIGGSEPGKVCRLIVEDERHYRSDLFQQAKKIVKREQMLPQKVLDGFEVFTKAIAEADQSKAAAMDVDVPEEFEDALLCTVMIDPVLLPSGNVMDRVNIERIIMADDKDPFTNVPLKKEDLVPAVELKDKIHQWAAANNYPLE